jgi:hypothetical protein
MEEVEHMWSKGSRSEMDQKAKCLILLVRPGGLEPPTKSLGNSCSFHLSYGRTIRLYPPASAGREAGAAGQVSSG